MSERKTLTVAESAEWLGIGKTLAYELIKRGDFPVRVIELGTGAQRRKLIVRADLERYLSGETARTLQTDAAAAGESAEI